MYSISGTYMVYNTHWVILWTTYYLLPEQTLRILAHILIIVMEPKMQCSGGHWASQFGKWQLMPRTRKLIELICWPPIFPMKNPLVRSSLKQAAGPAILYVTWSIETVAPVGGLKVRKKKLKVRTKLPKNMGKNGVCFMLSNKFFWWILCDFRIFSIYVWHFFWWSSPTIWKFPLGKISRRKVTYPTKTREVKSSTQKWQMIGNMLVPSEAICLFIFLGREGIVPGINPNKFS